MFDLPFSLGLGSVSNCSNRFCRNCVKGVWRGGGQTEVDRRVGSTRACRACDHGRCITIKLHESECFVMGLANGLGERPLKPPWALAGKKGRKKRFEALVCAVMGVSSALLPTGPLYTLPPPCLLACLSTAMQGRFLTLRRRLTPRKQRVFCVSDRLACCPLRLSSYVQATLGPRHHPE